MTLIILHRFESLHQPLRDLQAIQPARSAGSPVVVGESLVDLIERRDGTVVAAPGGSPANVAVTLGRLGHHVTLVTDIGDDPHGDLVAEHLERSGVQIAEGSRRSGNTSTATARLDDSGAASYTFSVW